MKINDINTFIDKHRAESLWFLNTSFYPNTKEEYLKILKQIETHCDLDTFKKAKKLEKWLLQNFREKSVI